MSKATTLRSVDRDELLRRLAEVPDETEPTTSFEVSRRRWQLREAAVLRGFFSVSELPAARPSRSRRARKPQVADAEQVAFVRDDCERARTPHGGRWRLTAGVRRATVDHLQRRPDLLLRTLRGVREDPLDVGRTMAEAYLRGRARPLTEQTLDELAGTKQASEWLAGVVPDLPSPADVEAQVRLATLLAPLRILLDGPVLGREPQLRRLNDYVDRPADSAAPFRPLVISGPGGMGKSTLLATFLLEQSGRSRPDQAAPFAYLTFDREELVPQRPLDLLAEVLRQLAVEFPGSSGPPTDVAIRLEGLQERISALERDAGRTRSSNVEVWSRWQRDIDLLLRQFASAAGSVSREPLVCVFDTFERAQRQGSAPVNRLWDILARATGAFPSMRVVIAGRGGVPDHDVDPLDLKGLPADAARSLLLKRLGGRTVPPSLVDVVVERSRGNPLTIRLAAELMRRDVRTLRSEVGRRRFLRAFDQAEVQGVLYQRVLDHIDAPEAGALAIPGLVLRRITVELIRDVLAPAAGLGRIGRREAVELFDKLRAESSLVIEQDGALVHRTDVRAQVLPIIKRKDATLVTSVHRRAVAFYRTRSDTDDRTEELYHRLALGQGRRTLDLRWDEAAAARLDSALEEDLDPRVRAYLSTRLGISVDEEVLRRADDAEWTVQAARSARDLLDAGRPVAAVVVLEERDPDPLDFTVAALYVEALARCGRSEEARERAARALATAAERGDTAEFKRFSTLAAQLAEDRGDFDRALALLAEARERAQEEADVVQETALGVSMLRLLRRQGRLEHPEAVALQQDVVRLARTLTRKQRTSSPGLVRDLAAEIGKEAPEFVSEASEVVGVDVTSEQAQQHLSARGKDDAVRVALGILEGEGDAVGVRPDITSQEQGATIGKYLREADDANSAGALSEYFQVEADAASFEPG